MSDKRIVIVGAGLAGLSCALRLQELGVGCRILEKSECVGGRVRTHVVDGYRMDRGFQVLLTAYPRTQQTVDYGALELKAFHPGAQIRFNGKFHTLGDPSRRPSDMLATLFSPVGTLRDKTRMLHLRDKISEGSIAQLMARPEVTTQQRLREYGFFDKMIQQFFRPFLGGIFLEPALITSSRKFEFVMRMFSQGEAALPRLGMQAIPQQILNELKTDSLRTGCPVKSIEAHGVDTCRVTLESGERVAAEIVVLATTELEAARLQCKPVSVRSASATCLYYAAGCSPVRGPWLVLNGDRAGPINNLCVPTELHATYAPPGKSLVSVTVLGVSDNEARLEQQVRAQLVDWYGEVAAEWRHLRTYAVPEALTLQEPPSLEVVKKPVRISATLFACGDYLSVTSIEGAIASGIRCADEICPK
jgi:phytoene dehydrogenase-like protein